MRARKLAVASREDISPVDDVMDVFVDEDAPVVREEDDGPLDRICIACGGDGPSHDCPHGEVARLDGPSRAIRDATARLRRAAAEHRAAVRALRALVLSEVARGRGDLETTPAPRPEPCPRCLIRDAEEAAAVAGTPRPVKRKGRGDVGQQALLFKGS